MSITAAQKKAIEEVYEAIVSVTAPRGKRQICGMFMDLVDRAEWPEYYEVIPEPRCLKNIKAGVEKGRYRDALDAYTDLSLVFWNAIFYNEPGSQISLDAASLKSVLETEWKKRPVLPQGRTSPPPAAPQKVHRPEPKPKIPAPATASPQPSRSRALTPAHTATPNSQTITLPGASSSSLAPPDKSGTTRASSALRQITPDVDVDVVDSDGQVDDAAMEMERDPDSEEIVKQLEKSLPRWPGYSEEGWANELTPERMVELVQGIKSHKDANGNRLAVVLEAVSEETSIANLSFSFPLSLNLIETRTRAKEYSTAQDFDKAVIRLFEKARRWHDPCTEAYGRVLLLQRLYQSLTSSHPPPGPVYVSSSNFAALRAGPGNTKPVHGADGEGVAGVTSHRVSTRDRTFVDELHYKGWSVKLADWLHLSNPDDPSRPIIAHVFRCWISDEPLKKGQAGVTVSWYYRPEQTFHSSNRSFWEGEVFKTSHFADHPLTDIIEKIACQFTARHIRGRPRPPYWYPGWPLYVCDSRYNDRERVFVKIKNWNSCIPEEVRKSVEFMPIYPFELTVFPTRVKSPFLAGKGAVKGPGGIIAGAVETNNNAVSEGPEGTRKRVPRRTTAAEAPTLPVRTPYVAATTTPAQTKYQGPQAIQFTPLQLQTTARISQKAHGPDMSVITAAGGAAVLDGVPEKLSAEITKHFSRDPDTNEVLWFAAPPMNVARAPGARYSLTYLHHVATKRKREAEEAHERMVVSADNNGVRST